MELESLHSAGVRKAGTIFLVVLVIGALILAYFLYQKVIERGTYAGEDSSFVGTPKDTSESFNFPPLTDDERAALDQSPVNMFAQPAAVQKVATDAETLAIGTDCKVSPVVSKIQNGASLAVKNYDDVPHTITVNTHTSKARAYSVPAHGSVAMTADFGKTGGSYSIYSMSCEKSPAVIGMLMVVE